LSKFSSKYKWNGFKYPVTLKSKEKSWNFLPETSTDRQNKKKENGF
jgi:hypothetical protein